MSGLTVGSCLSEETLDSFRDSVAKASREADLTYGELDDVVRRIDSLDGEKRAQAIRFIAKTDADGIEAVSDLSDDELRKLLSITYDGNIDGQPSELVDNELTAKDIVELTDEKIALDETMGVVEPENPYQPENLDTVWLEKGRLGSAADSDEWIEDEGGAGWAHIKHNHVDTPSGNEFAQKFGPKYEDPDEVKKLIIESIRKGEPVKDDGDIIYVYEVNGKTISTVVGDNGFVVTSVPTDLTD